MSPCVALMGYCPNPPKHEPTLGIVPVRLPVTEEREPRRLGPRVDPRKGLVLGPKEGSRVWQLWQRYAGQTIGRDEVVAIGITRNNSTAYLRDLVACGKATRLGDNAWRVAPLEAS